MQACNSSSSTEFYTPPSKKKTHRPLVTSPHSLDLRLDTGLWIGGISAGWLGAKSPWLPQSSNWLFHILLCPGIICLCSARTGWDQMSLACTVKVSYPHLGPSKTHFCVVERVCGLVGLNGETIRKTTSEAPLFWSAPEQQAGVLPRLVLLQNSGGFSRSNISVGGEGGFWLWRSEGTPVSRLNCKRMN